MRKLIINSSFFFVILISNCSRWQFVNLTQEISSKKLSKTETVFFDLTTIKINSSGEIIHNQLFSDFEINEALKSGLIKYGNIYQLQPYFTDNKSNQDFLVKITRLSMTSSAKENGANSITVNAFAELYQSNSPKKIRSKFFSLSKEKNVVMNDQLEQKKIISTLIEGLTERIDIWINKRIYKLQKN